jgi:hypothetical protein
MVDLNCVQCNKIIRYTGTNLPERDQLLCLDCLRKLPSFPGVPDDGGDR